MTYSCGKTFAQAVKLIHAEIDQDIRLEDIAKRVGVSLATLKRMFVHCVEMSPGAFIRRVRLEAAFLQLKANQKGIDAALSVGYQDQSAFIRAFKKAFGLRPSQAKACVNIVNELEHCELGLPEILQTQTLTFQVVTKQGSYFDSAPAAWQSLREVIEPHRALDDLSSIFVGISHDNPHDGDVAPDQVRFSAGIWGGHDFGLARLTLEAGRYAKFQTSCKIYNLGLAFHYIYGAWQQKSGESIAKDKVPFTVFDAFPDVAKTDHMQIYVPLDD